MKITEIKWEDGKKYKDSDGDIWTVDCYDLYDEENDCITNFYNLKSVLEFEFEEFIDWSKVEVDTPVWVSPDGENWTTRHFAEYKNEKVYCWEFGRTSHTCDNSMGWNYVTLTKPEQV